jgi:cyclopropane-fatty-acyl-phospholipid synthase
MALAATSEIDANVRFLDGLFRGRIPERVGFKFWDGSTWPDDRPREARLVLKHAGSVRAMFDAGTEKAIAEAFLRDDLDIEGDIESAFELVDVLRQNGVESWRASLRSFRNFRRLPARTADGVDRAFSGSRTSRHSLKRDREVVSFHYDVSNDFFKLWLDRQMIYSCAYFERADLNLDEAQEAKLHLLCRKLRLRSGQRVLDIGCGWGALAIFAARHYGVHVTGITLSRKQADFASARVNAAGLERMVSIELKDYRELRVSDPFDAIVSVGMAEHVGAIQLTDYFKVAARLLRPGGTLMNHAIGEGVRPATRMGPSFIEEYVFPDSEIPPLPIVLQAAESAGLEVRDVENLREHYTLTLRHWVRQLEAAHAEAVELVGEATFRIWRLYMAGSAHGFARGRMAVYQTLLSKPDSEGHSHLPLTRRDWY